MWNYADEGFCGSRGAFKSKMFNKKQGARSLKDGDMKFNKDAVEAVFEA